MVEIAELVDFIEDAAGGAGDGGVVELAFLTEIPEVGVEVLAVPNAPMSKGLGRRLFRERAAKKPASTAVLKTWRRGWLGLFRGEEGEDHGAERAVFGAGAGHFHVQAVVDVIGSVDGAPVGGDEAFEADFVTENLDQHVGIAAGLRAVDLVVGAHDGGDAGLDCIDEGRDVDFVEGLLVDEDVGCRRCRRRHSAWPGT
jgi:hypothetical protein